MDFGTLLHVAKKNSESTKNEGKYYSTKFAPPKKVCKEKKLSDNIQKFLQKRDHEEKERQREEREKVNNLLAMRDEKSKNKIRKMLKVTKSANKSVLDDAINTEHTAVTMDGPEQPDQDDYGYVSTEANAFYQKYIEKVKDVKEDKGFAPSRPQSLKDLSGTKERVKAAITREIEEKKTHTRQRTSTVTSSSTVSSSKDPSSSISRSYNTSSKPLYNPEAERRDEERKKREEDQKKARSRKAAPPPMDFQALLKLAEKKQHEPLEIVQEVKKKKEPERLLTSKEKLEMEEIQRAKEARKRRERERNGEIPVVKDRKEHPVGGVRVMEPNGRIPKLNQAVKPATTNAAPAVSRSGSGAPTPKSSAYSQGSHSGANGFKKPNPSAAPSSATSSKISSNGSSSSKNASASSSSKPSTTSAKATSSSSVASQSATKSATPSSSSSSSAKTSSSTSALTKSKNPYGSSTSKNPYNGPAREFPPRDMKSIKPRQFPPQDVKKTRQFPPQDVQKTRQFPPADVRRGVPSRPGDRGKPQPPKRRILDDDDEDEYDSELDDFIDDGDVGEDYSSHIKEIFGYDKSKYRDIDDYDDAAMESNFAQVQREEFLSKKIGMQEDLEDMKLEALEKKRKMMSKKRRLND